MFHYENTHLCKRMVLSSVFLLLQSVPTAFAVAENVTPTPPPLPVVEKAVGQPITITWSDGRKAVLAASETISERVSLPLSISENSCEPSLREKCEYRSGLSVSTYRLIWAQHSDATKIGETVRFGMSTDANRENLVAQIAWTQVDNMLFPGLQEPTLADELACPSWNWLAPGTSPPLAISIPSISTEFMFPNPNTNQVENKTIMTASEVVWRRTDADTLQVQSIGRFDSIISLGFNALFIGDVMKWNIERSKNLYCDIGFKVDLGKLQFAFQAILDRSLKSPFTLFVGQKSTPYAPSQLASVLDLKPDFHSALTVYE